MTIQTIIDAGIFSLRVSADSSRSVSKVFCCDLLSIAMNKAPTDGAWVTVTGNRNTLAVASLTGISCIILAEGMQFQEEDLTCAKKEGIAIFTTSLSVFDAALKIHELFAGVPAL